MEGDYKTEQSVAGMIQALLRKGGAQRIKAQRVKSSEKVNYQKNPLSL